MRVLGADLASLVLSDRKGEGTVVLLDEGAHLAQTRRPTAINEAVQEIVELASGDPFLLAVNVPVVVPASGTRARPVENLVRRRLGHRLPPGGRAALPAARGGAGGEALLAALAAAGQPCLPYPDRDRRTSGLAEIHAPLVLKALVWQRSAAATNPSHPDREAAFKACEPAPYRAAAAPRAGWAERAFALDAAMRTLGFEEGFDLRSAWDALAAAANDTDVERAGSMFDAILLAATAHRYLESPEDCAFVGDRDGGYVILPADGFVRRLAVREGARQGAGGLFPKTSLRERLAPHAAIRSLELVPMPGRAPRLEAVFEDAPPRYEFDNLDEMMWWKHCRHVAGPELPLDGLQEIVVRLDGAVGQSSPALRLLRSRHKVLSFRFEPASAWRGRIATRDGKTYPFDVLRATYEARTGEGRSRGFD